MTEFPRLRLARGTGCPMGLVDLVKAVPASEQEQSRGDGDEYAGKLQGINTDWLSFLGEGWEGVGQEGKREEGL